MDTYNLWSLRLGFSGKESKTIEKMGLTTFLKHSFATKFSESIPDFLSESPKNLEELKARRKQLELGTSEANKEMIKKEVQVAQEMKIWWLKKMQDEPYPLREKMTCFWHNHFVATFQKVRVNHWIFQHNQLLRKEAFGNFRELTKKVIQTNAMVRYLDNTDNKRDKINENLSRELLELFTLGIGNYTESDIKNGAKGLAGLHLGEEHAVYRPLLQNNEEITYFNKSGKFKADELVDIIFEQKAVPYLITQKILQWFIYDNPQEQLIRYYGDYFRKVDYEIEPLLIKIFTEEFEKNTAGSKIKDPLVYLLQLTDTLNIKNMNPRVMIFFLSLQGMDLFNQPNVKGWKGGREWLTSQIYLQRNNAADLLCSGKSLERRKLFLDTNLQEVPSNSSISVKVAFDTNANNKEIINELKNRLLFHVDENKQYDFENILKYDFNPKSEGAELAVLRLCNAMFKTPEFQLI